MRLMHPARGPSLCRRGSCIWDGISGIAPRPLRRWGEKGGVPAAVRQLRQKNIKALGPLLCAGQVVQVCKRAVVPGQLRRLPGGSAVCTAVEQGPVFLWTCGKSEKRRAVRRHGKTAEDVGGAEVRQGAECRICGRSSRGRNSRRAPGRPRRFRGGRAARRWADIFPRRRPGNAACPPLQSPAPASETPALRIRQDGPAR